MIRFNDNDLVVGYIKEFLHEFNLPKCKVWKEDGFYSSNEIIIKGSDLYQLAGIGNRMNYLQHYVFGESLKNITKNLEIRNNVYDSYTHKYLGEYLRFIRDFKKIDLMSMYNCFSDEVATSLNLNVPSSSNNTKVFSSDDEQFKIYKVSVKFGQDYTIALDCDSYVEIVAGVYNNDRLFAETESTDLYRKTYMKTSGTRFKHPFLYTKLKDINPKNRNGLRILDSIYDQEQNLVLFIKVPKECNSSLVVLEGNYVDGYDFYFYGGLNQQKNGVVVYNYEKKVNKERKYISKLQLLQINSGINHPFADRLLEYLFDSVITPVDEIDDNIVRVQQRLISRYKEYTKDENTLGLNPKYKAHDGVYDDNLRNVVYDITNKEINKYSYSDFDMIGYVDKDAESIIGEDE